MSEPEALRKDRLLFCVCLEILAYGRSNAIPLTRITDTRIININIKIYIVFNWGAPLTLVNIVSKKKDRPDRLCQQSPPSFPPPFFQRHSVLNKLSPKVTYTVLFWLNSCMCTHAPTRHPPF